MEMLPGQVEWQFHRNYQRHVFAKELVVKIQQLKGCFTGDTLPAPTDKMITAWKNLPNNTVDNLVASIKTASIPPQAPPPTPTKNKFDINDAASRKLALRDNHDGGRVFVNTTDLPLPDMEARRTHRGSATNDKPPPRYNYLDQYSEKENIEEYLLPTSEGMSPSPISEQGSSTSGDQHSSTSAEFYNLANQWFLDYRARGTNSFVESLIAFGVISAKTGILASRIARTVIKMVAKASYTEGKNLENALRFAALASFQKCWNSNNTWMEMPSITCGIRIAGLIGSMFDAKVTTARDIHLCWSFLLEEEKTFDRLCAMRALLIQANDKLCKSRYFSALMEFRIALTSRDKESGKYLWDNTPLSKEVITDILATIENWMASQALRREQIQAPTGNCIVRNKAVGPRLRGGTMAMEKSLQAL